MTAAAAKPVLGLIGAIGAGKSTAARLLAGLGGGVVDCDKLGHLALELPDVKRQLVARWGGRVVAADGSLDRRAVGGFVFADPAERLALEAVVFPAIGALTDGRLVEIAADPAARFAVLDAAVLLEAGWHDRCSKVLYLDARQPTRLARLAARSGWTAADLAAREAAQWPADRKKACADAVVVNDGPVADLSAALARLVTGWGWTPAEG